ncbi:hypothetical protein GGI15_002029 [Coemansia interrupta]|uniref:DSBA-like thioredoxin domain-containing protein n=1 Tax=Coemansia interrupta TaxID=1126814 RepID=A0A9W8HLS9_9FUNG|nr:hypothetical protein GGI15_002029 [Coemansia interrupta]
MSSAPAVINFWFEFASPYSMISALRLFHALTNTPAPRPTSIRNIPSCSLPPLTNIRIAYQPIFLGALFKAVGNQQLPNMTVPLKGHYLFHDVHRSLNLFGCPGFPESRPQWWPRNTALAGRMAWMLTQGPEYIRVLDSGRRPSKVVVQDGGMQGAEARVVAEFVWRVFEAEFIANEDIGSAEVMSRLWDAYVARPGHTVDGAMPEGQRAVVLANEEAVREGFRENTQMAAHMGVFGAPTFTTDDGDLYWGNDRLIEAVNHSSAVDSIAQNAGFCLRARGASL